jgi:hypothetical protein
MSYTHTKIDEAGSIKAVVVLQVDLLPKGGGNRAFARRLADAFEEHAVIGPHVERVICGTSRVVVEFDASFDAVEAVTECRRRLAEIEAEERARQMRLAF